MILKILETGGQKSGAAMAALWRRPWTMAVASHFPMQTYPQCRGKIGGCNFCGRKISPE